MIQILGLYVKVTCIVCISIPGSRATVVGRSPTVGCFSSLPLVVLVALVLHVHGSLLLLFLKLLDLLTFFSLKLLDRDSVEFRRSVPVRVPAAL